MIRRAGFLSLLATQGLWTSFRTPRLPPASGPVDGVEGEGPRLTLLALGDSIIAGVGVRRSLDALPATLARQLANVGGRRVHWRALGSNGARSSWVLEQLEQFKQAVPPSATPDLLVISNGINDVTTPQSESAVLDQLLAVVHAAERRFPHALVCQLGLPPLGEFPALPQPLRQALGRRASRIDQALGRRLAGRPATVHLPLEGSPDFGQFAHDGYHPGEAGVADWAGFLAPRLLDRLPGQAAGESRGPRDTTSTDDSERLAP